MPQKIASFCLGIFCSRVNCFTPVEVYISWVQKKGELEKEMEKVKRKEKGDRKEP